MNGGMSFQCGLRRCWMGLRVVRLFAPVFFAGMSWFEPNVIYFKVAGSGGDEWQGGTADSDDSAAFFLAGVEQTHALFGAYQLIDMQHGHEAAVFVGAVDGHAF